MRNVSARSRFALLALLALTVATTAIFLVQSRGGQSARAQTAGPTYLLSDFAINYPSTIPGKDADLSQAVVHYGIAWSGDAYPGEVDCHITVKDAAGDAVGNATFGLDWPEPSANTKGSSPVDVTGNPSTASGSCDPGSYPTGSGYSFKFTGVTDGDQKGESTLHFATNWTTSSYPATRTCSLQIAMVDGTTHNVGPFTMVVGNASDEITMPVQLSPPSSISRADIKCAELQPTSK